jgi:hypothetical protein
LRFAVLKYFAVLAEESGDRVPVAVQLSDRGDGDGFGTPVDPTGPAPGMEVVEGDVHVHRRG